MIPFYKPNITGKEEEYLKDAMKSLKISGDGKYSQMCCELMKKKFQVNNVLLTTSCTHSLELAAMAIGIKEGDEVIMPSYTFVSTANAFALRGAKPVFVDIRKDTLNIDENKIEEKITSKTKAIVVVHYAGVSCEMDKIMDIANKYNIPVVEDAAQAVNSKYKGKYLGTIGNLGCYSFHDTKNYTCGEGGAILINDPKYNEKIEIIREKGTNRKKFLRGEIDKYTWIDIGSSYLLSDILAAFLYGQLENMDEINIKRKSIYTDYLNGLKDLRDKITLPTIPNNIESNYHIFYLLAKDEKERNALIDYLKQNEIQANAHYSTPLHLSPIGINMGYKIGDFPLSESASSRLLRLPFFVGLTKDEQNKIISIIKEFYSIR